MFRVKSFSIISVLAAFVLFMYSCGSSGGGGAAASAKTEAQITNSNSADAAGGVAQALGLTGMGDLIGTASTGGGAGKSPLMIAIEKPFSLTGRSSLKASVGKAGSGSITATEDCLDGGTMTYSASWSDHNRTTDAFLNFAGSVTFSACIENNVTIAGSQSFSITGWSDSPTAMGMSADMTVYNTKGTSATADDDDMRLSGYSVSLSDITYDADTQEVTAAKLAMNGTITGIADGNPVNLGFDLFSIEFSKNISGETVGINGSLYVPCVGGWVEIATTMPVFKPAGGGCPTAGDVTISSGGNSARVVYNGDGSVDIYFNDAAISEHFDSCEDINGRCG